MFINKKFTKEHILRDIICLDISNTKYITLNNVYKIFDVINTHDNKQILLIEDDGGYLNGYESERFIDRYLYSDIILDSIIS